MRIAVFHNTKTRISSFQSSILWQHLQAKITKNKNTYLQQNEGVLSERFSSDFKVDPTGSQIAASREKNTGGNSNLTAFSE